MSLVGGGEDSALFRVGGGEMMEVRRADAELALQLPELQHHLNGHVSVRFKSGKTDSKPIDSDTSTSYIF
ncbi:MAG: hypothetical protein OK454_11410, partial [Thaumarchaeota archaeon]|nr:hypothetical protein [Nitrososphaerota archaeon]